ncbi:hypothetical protein T484DRAFT_1796244 [Baffinella frigidus]|nr:hypothetical protein T484DRAFT_1796244 [Cryptophyta sp. CCMP2293]
MAPGEADWISAHIARSLPADPASPSFSRFSQREREHRKLESSIGNPACKGRDAESAGARRGEEWLGRGVAHGAATSPALGDQGSEEQLETMSGSDDRRGGASARGVQGCLRGAERGEHLHGRAEALRLPRARGAAGCSSSLRERHGNGEGRRAAGFGGARAAGARAAGVVGMLAVVLLCVQPAAGDRSGDILFFDGAQDPFNLTFVYVTPRKTVRGLPPWFEFSGSFSVQLWVYPQRMFLGTDIEQACP